MSRSLSDWLNYLETVSAARQPGPSFSVREDRFDALMQVAHSLDLFPCSIPVVTVGGTNGKGSCVSLLSHIFCKAGYWVGTFTSPHLVHYNERIQINQTPVSDQQLCEAFEAIEKARQEHSFGYFEFTTLVGLLLFKQANLDLIVLEVGMGGRLDPVNMIDADISIISSVDLDHTHILGDTIEAIAFEKAGIMRSNKPCIWGDKYVPNNVIQYAKSLDTPLSVYNKDFKVLCEQHTNTWEFLNHTQHFTKLPKSAVTHLPNAACVLQTIMHLKERLPVAQKVIYQGLLDHVLPGRFQLLPGKVKTILDVAHNPASAVLLANHLRKTFKNARVLAVIAILNTKDAIGILQPLKNIVTDWYVTEFNYHQCMSAIALANQLAALSVTQYEICWSVKTAYQAALQAANPNDVIVVMGSFHTVGEIMQLINDEKNRL